MLLLIHLLILNFDKYNKMNPKILSQDSNYDEWCEQEIINAYQQAAEFDEYLFGDYDYCKEWIGISTA